MNWKQLTCMHDLLAVVFFKYFHFKQFPFIWNLNLKTYNVYIDYVHSICKIKGMLSSIATMQEIPQNANRLILNFFLMTDKKATN